MQELDLIKSEIQKVKNIIFSETKYNNKPIDDDIKRYLCAPAKNLRIALCILFSKSHFEKTDEKIYYCAAAIELTHNASLLHDDVIDEAETRRSQISFNKKTNSKTAILTGDLLIAKTMMLLNKISNKNIYHAFAETFNNMAFGEVLEYYSRYKLNTLEEYYKKNTYKTGELFKLAASIPFIINNEPQKAEFARNFAKHYANAFQIRDDIVNYFGLKDNKPTKTDNQQGIYTLPDIIKTQNNSANLYEESCKILEHQVNLSMDSLDFLNESKYKKAILSLCHNLLKGI